MAWDYAELSKAAKAFGGPEKLVEHIVAVSKRAGRIEMVPAIGVAFASGVVITKVIDYFKTKKEITQAELEAAKAEIIDGIKEYDALHSETTVSEIADCEAEHQGELDDK